MFHPEETDDELGYSDSRFLMGRSGRSAKVVDDKSYDGNIDDNSKDNNQDDLLARENLATPLKKRKIIETNKGSDSETVDESYGEESDEKIDDEDTTKFGTSEFCPALYRNDDFFAESPYFHEFVDKEINTMAAVKEIMNDIAKKTEAFAYNGLQMVVATRELASSCKLHKTRLSTLELEAADVLERLGDVLDEMASAQEHLCHFLESSTVSSMQSIAEKDKKMTRLYNEAHNKTDQAEQVFMKYFYEGKDSYGTLDSCNDSKHNRRGSMSTVQPSHNKGKHTGFLRMGMEALQRRRVSLDTVNQSPRNNTQVVRWRNDLSKIRTLQISAELKRYQLGTHVFHSCYQQNVDISRCANQMVGEMSSYFSHCSNLATGLIHCTTNMKTRCEKFQLNHENRRWEEREQLMYNVLALARENEIREPKPIMDPPTHVYDLREENEQIWNLPAALASYTRHCRPIAKGVLAEGWLHRKNYSSRIYRNSKKSNRSWFFVRKDGIFNFQPNTEGCKNKNYNGNSAEFTMDVVKVCDLQLCTVRECLEIKQDPSTRFCFELITPSNYSDRLILQARGPHELKKWLDAIRFGISCRLVEGKNKSLNKIDHVPAMKEFGRRFSMSNICNNKSKTPRRMSLETRVTFSESHRSLFDKCWNESASGSNPFDLTSEMRELMKANPTCADCGVKCPEWVSLNLGILICAECSGCHRSLGAHISKVRSLTFDVLSHRELLLLLSLGNSCVNQFWEKETTTDFQQRQVDRENWIFRKYVKKEFIGTSVSFPGESKVNASRKLYNASRKANIVGVAKEIIYGGDVNWKNPEEENKTALEICGVDAQGQKDKNVVECCKELLFQNGAEMNSMVTSISQ